MSNQHPCAAAVALWIVAARRKAVAELTWTAIAGDADKAVIFERTTSRWSLSGGVTVRSIPASPPTTAARSPPCSPRSAAPAARAESEAPAEPAEAAAGSRA